MMRTAIVIPVCWNASAFSLDAGLLVREFRDLGHEVCLHCLPGSRYSVDYPVREATLAELESPDYWREHRPDMALVWTWMGFGKVLQAVADAGAITVSHADTDGLLGIRVHPRAQLQRMIYGHHTQLARARALWFWLRKYAGLHPEEEASIIASLERAHLTVVALESSRKALGRFLSGYSRAHLSSKVSVVANPVSQPFLNTPLTVERADRVVAAGRWDDPVKQVELLGEVLERTLDAEPGTEAIVLGAGGDRVFGRLSARQPRIRYLGKVPHAEMVGHLATSRVCLVTSRWESYHLAAHEALCLGCSVVGPPLGAITDMCKGGSFGTVARDSSPSNLTAALREELGAWRDGRRKPTEIAAHWREQMSPNRLVLELLQLVKVASPDRFPEPAQEEVV